MVALTAEATVSTLSRARNEVRVAHTLVLLAVGASFATLLANAVYVREEVGELFRSIADCEVKGKRRAAIVSMLGERASMKVACLPLSP